MRPLLVVILIGGLAVAGLAWTSSVRPEPDAPVPSALARWIEPAREAARREAGAFGLVPARFVEARCSPDGRTALLTFESAIGSVPSFAIIGFPAPEDWNAPGATVVIAGSAPHSPGESTVEACARVPAGPPG